MSNIEVIHQNNDDIQIKIPPSRLLDILINYRNNRIPKLIVIALLICAMPVLSFIICDKFGILIDYYLQLTLVMIIGCIVFLIGLSSLLPKPKISAFDLKDLVPNYQPGLEMAQSVRVILISNQKLKVTPTRFQAGIFHKHLWSHFKSIDVQLVDKKIDANGQELDTQEPGVFSLLCLKLKFKKEHVKVLRSDDRNLTSTKVREYRYYFLLSEDEAITLKQIFLEYFEQHQIGKKN